MGADRSAASPQVAEAVDPDDLLAQGLGPPQEVCLAGREQAERQGLSDLSFDPLSVDAPRTPSRAQPSFQRLGCLGCFQR
jgi:hypothetical protein